MPSQGISVVRVTDVLIVTMPADPDDTAVASLQELVLSALAEAPARGVVLDIGAVETLDSFFARTISESAQMIELMGSRTVVAGMRPSVAITATQLGLQLKHSAMALNAERAVALLAQPPDARRYRNG
jgi:rsbT antagonist protein RsbS